MWWVWLPLVSGLLCPSSIECGNTRTYNTGVDYCGILQPPFVTISVAGCNYTDNYSFCRFNRMMEQYLSVKQGEYLLVPCEWWNVTELHEEYMARIPDLISQEAFHRTQRLSVGTHPKRCESYVDCLLDSGEYADCVCSSLSTAFCSLSLGDDFMLTVFDYAKENNRELVDYYLSYQAAYNYLYSRLDCPMLFVENQLILDVQSTVRAVKRANNYIQALYFLLPVFFLTVLALF